MLRKDEEALVSVVIPCYKQAHFLPEALKSVLAQTYSSVEAIVVDDGSPDNTAQVAALFPGVNYVRQQNRGIAEARNAGFRASQGNYVIFLDADDRLMPDAAKRHLQCFAENPSAGFVVGDIDQIASDGSYLSSPRWPVLTSGFYEELLKANHVANTIAVMFRRGVLEAIGGFKTFFAPAEDYEMLLRAGQQFSSAHHRTVVAQYRRYETSISRKGAIMLRAMNRVMQSQQPFVEKSPTLRKALGKGEAYWRDHFGAAAVKEVYAQLVRCKLFAAAKSSAALLWYVGWRLIVLPWTRRRRIFRVIRERFAYSQKLSSDS